MTKRRILAILLSLLLLVQALPTSALAATLYSNTARGASYPTVTFKLASSVDENGALVYGTTVEQLVEAGGTAVVPDVPNVDGYKFTGWDKDVTAAINEDTTFTAQYSPIGVYTVTVKYVFADESSASETLSYDYEDNGKENTLSIAVPAMTGFTPSVKDENGDVVAIEGNTFTATFSGAKTYTVTYDGAVVTYKVNHYQQNWEDTNYPAEPAATDTMSGKAGTLTAGVAKTYEGFTAPETIEQKNINPDGSTVVDVYYTRNTYKLTYETEGGTYVDNEVVPYGATVKLPPVSQDGYTFDGWEVTVGGVAQQDYAKDVESFTMPAGNVVLTAKWIANDEASYTVIYWQQSKSDKYDTTAKTYDYVCTKVRTGDVGDPTTYDRLTSDELYDYNYSKLNTTASVNKTIEADGSTVVNVYYDRVVMTLTFNYDRKTYETLKGLYGQSFEQADVSWPFEYKWTIGNTTMTFMDAFVKQSSNFNGDEDYEYVFSGSTQSTIALKHYLQNVDGTWPSEPKLTCYASGGDLTLNNKFEGFTVAYFRHTSGCGDRCAYKDHEWRAGSASSGAGDTDHLIEVRHTRNQYVLSFENCNDAIDAVTLPYQQKLSEGKPTEPADFATWRPSNVDDDYSFDGWYLDEACQQPVDWTKEMPSHNMQVFAKWKAPEKTVKYHLNYTGAEDPYASFTVLKYEKLANNTVAESGAYTLPSDPAREGYTFEGWYTDPACTKPLVEDFGNVQIAKDWNIYAKWVSTEEKETTTSLVTTANVEIESYIDENGVEQPISTIDMPIAMGTVGETVTLEAPNIPGYVPVSKFVTHVIQDDSENPNANVVKIQYTKLDTWMLTVNYVDKATGEPIADPDSYANLTATTKAVVYRVIPGGTDEVTGKDYIWQATSYVQTGAKADAEANDNGVLEATVTFEYKKVYEAEYKIEHWVESTPGSYTRKETDTLNGWTGYTATASADDAKDYSADNLEFNAGNTNNVLSVTIQEDATLKLYYELQVANYTVKHLLQDVDDAEKYTEVEADRETISGTIGDKTAAEANTYTGFTAQSFEQKTIAADGSTVVEIKYNRNTYNYVIHHVEKDNVANKLATDTTGEAKFGAVIDVTAAQQTIEGFSYDSDSGDITIAVEGNEATIYYSRNSYKVTYAYTGDVPAGASDLPAEATYKYGDSVTVAPNATADGYTFSGWSTGDFTMPANDVEITGSWTIRSDLAYTVNYYWNGTTDKLADSKTVTGQTFDATVTESPIAVEGYTPVSSDSKSVKITTGANVIDFYYYKNVEITATSDEVTYNGAEQSVSGFTGAPEGADFSAITVGAKGTNVDTYPAAFAEGTVGTVDATEKYIITKATDGKLVINKMALTITADSATKEYDGTALTKDSYTNTALAAGDAIASVTVTGSQTVVGKSDNVASAALIKEGDTDVTANYDITYEKGTLEVTKSTKSIKVVANSHKWDYDGADHADGGYTVTFGDDETYTVAAGKSATLSTGDIVTATITKTVKNVADTAAGNNVIDSLVVSNADQYETIESEAGTLTIKPINATVTIVGNHDTDVYDGTEHKVEDYTATADTTLYDVTKDFTFSGTAVAARTEEGTTNMGLIAEQFANTNGNFATVTFNVTDGYQTITPVDEVVVTITGKTSTVDYDGAVHSVSGYDVAISNPLYKETDFTFTGTAAASRTDAGKTTMGLVDTQFANTNANFKTVIFNVTDGYQEILPIDVTVEIVGNNNTTTYDGQPHTVTGYTATASTDLYDVTKDFTFGGTATASRTDVGTAYMGLTKEQFQNTNANFKTVTFNVTDGYQTITPLEGVVVTITENSGEANYDGQSHTVTGYTAEASSDLYDVENDFSFTGNDSVSGINADTYNMELKSEDFTNTNTNFADVTFVIEDGQLVIKPIDVTVTIVGANNTAEYDGEEHEVSGYTATADTELYDVTKDFSFSGTAVAARTDVGQTDMGLTAEQFQNTNTNFATVTFEVTDGYQKITPVAAEVVVTIVGKNDTTDYDGAEHGVSGYDVTNISNALYTVADFSFSGTAEAKRTDAGQTDMGLTAEQFTNINSNFSKVTFQVTDGYQKINPIDVTVTITGHNNTTVYDGEEHTVTGYDVEIGNSLYKEADFTFTGTASAIRTEEGTTYMGLAEDQFANTNGNFATVTFVVTDGYQTITPVDAVVVTIIGNTSTVDYDGEEHTVTDYTATANNELYDVEKDFTFSGTAEAKRTDVGTTYMNLAADQFQNTNGNFKTVTFQVTDGYQKVEPIDVTVTIVGNNSTNEYDGTEHTVTGYVATASTELYDVTKDFTFSGTAEAKRTEVGKTDMGLAAGQFANTNSNFATVTFEVTDGYQAITPMDDLVTVTIVGNNSTVDYDGEAHTVTGFEATVDNELYDVTKDFTFSGTASATRTDAGTTNMELVDTQFANINENFSNVKFVVTDGYQKINPIDVTVTITGHNNTTVYDGEEHTVTGYDVAISNDLYKEADFTFSGNATASRTEEGTTNMGLTAEQFANTNDNFATVTFEVTDGYQTITPVTDEVVVTIVGNNVTKTYDGVEYTASGYAVEISNPLYTEADFAFNGTAEVKRTDVGTTDMGLATEQFANISDDFANVKFVVTDGYVTINPRPITVIADSNTKVYDATALTDGDYLVLDGAYAEAPADATYDQNGKTIIGTEKITATVSGSQTLVGESANTVATVTIDGTQYAATAEKFGNYAVTFIAGTLVVTEPEDDSLVVNKVHEGEEFGLGETVTFTITVKNIYDAVKTITITEKTGVTLVGDTDGDGKLVFENVAAGETVTATATYVITSDDILAGTFVNKVEVSFNDGPTYSDEDPVDPEVVDTTLTVEKVSDTKGAPIVLDQVITYTITVTNDGNVPFYNVKVTDEWTDDEWTIETLAVGESKTFKATYTVTSDDILAGTVVNEVVAKGEPIQDPDGGEKIPEGKDDVTDTTDDVDTTLTVKKETTSTPAKEAGYALGESITYKITVKNEGNVPFTNVVVTDELTGDEWKIAELAVGATETFTATYIVTSDDILVGKVANAVTAEADPVKDPDGEDKIPTDDDKVEDETDDVDATLEVVKTSDVAEGETVSLGDTITYTITVTNKGNVPFYDVVVKDEMVGFEDTIEVLAVGASETFTVTYVVTSDDIKAGEIVNAVTAEGDPIDDPKNPDEPKTPEGGDEEEDPTDDLDTTLTVVKTSDVAEGETVSLGDTITYTITVTNEGNVPFTNVKVTDEWTGDSWTIEELAVGATETYTATHVVTSDGILAGKVVNEVVAEGDPIDDPKNPEEPKTPTDDDEVEDETDDLDTTLTVVKTTTSTPANGETYALNEKITYEITVTNEGNVPFKNVVVTDELTGDEWTIEVLAVGESKTFTAEYVVVEADIKAGSVINEVTAKGDEIDDPKNPDDPKQPEGKDDEEDPTDEPNPAYTIVKVRTDEPANGEFYELGEEVEFEITVTNTGNVTLNGIVVKEELEGALFENGTDEMTIESLPPLTGNVVKFTATYVITEDDLGKDDLANTLSAKDSDGNEPDPIDPTPIPVDDATAVTVTKVWDDLDNKYNTRTTITVNLLANGEAYGEPAVIAEDENGEWNIATFEKLPVHKNGEPIVYTVEEDAVAGYDTTYANEENSWTITNTLKQYTLTIRHWIHFVGGEVAAPNYERSVYYGETYNVRSANVIGFWPNPRYTTGVVTGDMVHDVIYDELDFTLTVQYVYQNGATAAPTHVEKKLHYGDDYRVVSPKLEGYVASSPEISGYMGTRDLFFTVIYVPENTVIINEYGVPLGIGNVEMNVGDCFE